MSAAEAARYHQRQRVLSALASASDYYFDNLITDPKAGTARGADVYIEFLKINLLSNIFCFIHSGYIMKRGLSPATVFAFGIGFATSFPSSNRTLFANLTAEGFTSEELLLAGLCVNESSNSNIKESVSLKQIYPKKPKYYDRFRNRLMVPIRRGDGQVVGFGGRVLDDLSGGPSSMKYNPKYLNSPETMVFKKNSLLFGYDLARPHIRNSSSVIVVEGYFDVMSLYNAGVKNVVATMGTAISAEQLLLLTDRRNPREITITLLMDADHAGFDSVRRTCLQVLNKLPGELEVKIGR
jgi:DNA primase